jgi:hypothetical protein
VGVSDELGLASVPIYSPDDEQYRIRVHQNGRAVDQNFGPAETLFRRYPRRWLVNGKPVPLTMQFEEQSGISVNRSNYSEAQDVLEPDCCDGRVRIECVVLEFPTNDVPTELRTEDGTNRTFRFPLKHVPRETCYAHSEIWCNQEGNIELPYESPPKRVRDIFRAKLAARVAERDPREFQPVNAAE